jgi:hypothetical protein
MRTQIASRLARLERNTGRGSRRIVVVEDRATAKRARGGISRRAPLVSDELLSKLGTTGGRKGGKPENCDKSNDPRGGSRAMTQLEKGENRPKPEQDAKGRFVAGNSGNGGRPKGTRNELSEAFIADLCENWRKHGVSVCRARRQWGRRSAQRLDCKCHNWGAWVTTSDGPARAARRCQFRRTPNNHQPWKSRSCLKW